VPEYYLYPAELGLLKRFSREVVEILFPSKPEPASSSAGAQRDGDQAEQDGGKAPRRMPVPRWRVGDWGSDAVGRFNGGVNGEEGMDAAGKARGRREGARQSGVPLEGVVLELGAGSLSKTRSVLLYGSLARL
jgi:tRNA-specific adenosine deaminase 2